MSQQKQTDQELIKRVLGGERREYAQLVDRYKHMVFTLAVKMLRDRELAEECAQDVFVKAFQGLAGFRGTSKFSTWLYKIAYYRILDAVTSEKRKVPYEELSPSHSVHLEAEDSPWQSLVEAERRKLLEEALGYLEVEDHSMISLYYLQEQSIREISEITGLKEATVKVRLHRARKRLKTALSDKLSGKMLQEYER